MEKLYSTEPSLNWSIVMKQMCPFLTVFPLPDSHNEKLKYLV